MKIALDYDGTFTSDTRLWRAFIDLAKAYGHEVVCVTMRREHFEPVDASIGIPVIYTNRKAKKAAYQADIWIDDSPHWILQDAAA